MWRLIGEHTRRGNGLQPGRRLAPGHRFVCRDEHSLLGSARVGPRSIDRSPSHQLPGDTGAPEIANTTDQIRVRSVAPPRHGRAGRSLVPRGTRARDVRPGGRPPHSPADRARPAAAAAKRAREHSVATSPRRYDRRCCCPRRSWARREAPNGPPVKPSFRAW